MTRSRRVVRIAALAAAGAGVLWIVASLSAPQWTRRLPGPPAPAPPAPAADPAGAPAIAPPETPPLAAPPSGASLDPEEIERRRAVAARIRALIAEGPRDGPPGRFGGLLGDAEPVPIYRDGLLLGIELRDVAEGGFYERIGLAEGDLVHAIDGAALDDEGLAGALLWSLTKAREVELSVERRDGSEARITVPRDALLGELEALGEGG